MEWGIALSILGAAVAAGLAGIGSSLGVGIAGEAGAGLTTEDPEKFGRILLLQALPGTQGIYGFLAAFWVMLKLNLFVAPISVDIATGVQILCACIPVGIVGWLSGISQGRVSAAGVAVVARRPEETGKAIIYAAMVETYAVLSLLTTILLLNCVHIK